MIETKFKQTEIGLIPEDWKIGLLGELGKFSKGAGISREEAHTGIIPAIRYGEIYTSHDDYIKEFYSGISNDVATTAKRLNPGDLLFAASGETKEEIGKCVAFIDNKEAYAGGDIIILSPNISLHDSRYWGYYLNSSQVVKQKAARGQGDAVVHIVPKELASVIVAYPPKQEQSRIAEALSDIDKLIASFSKMIEKKQLMKQGTMQQLLTGKKRLPGFEGEWTKKKLGAIVDVLYGYLFTPNDYSTIGKYKVITISNVQEGKFNTLDSKKVDISESFLRPFQYLEIGDLLVSMTGNLGRVCIVTEQNCVMNYRVGKLFVKGADKYFIFHALNQKMFADAIIERISVYLPHNIAEQSAIANVLTTMDNEIESLEEERDKYIRVKEGMMQKLLTGQIRLVETEAKVMAMPKMKGANVHFKRSVLAAEIANRLCEEPTFGHVKMEKLIFLTEHLCHIDTGSHYHRDAAGPYDNTALRSIDKQMKQHQWFALTKKDKGYRYQPMDKRGDHKKYFDKYYASVLPMFDKVIETFKTSSTEQCEIVATLYSAWNDLLHRSQPFTDDDILNEVLNHWHDSKKRISSSRWQKALDWMRKNGFVPTLGNNN